MCIPKKIKTRQSFMDDTQLEFANKAKRMGKEESDQIQNFKKKTVKSSVPFMIMFRK